MRANVATERARRRGAGTDASAQKERRNARYRACVLADNSSVYDSCRAELVEIELSMSSIRFGEISCNDPPDARFVRKIRLLWFNRLEDRIYLQSVSIDRTWTKVFPAIAATWTR